MEVIRFKVARVIQYLWPCYSPSDRLDLSSLLGERQIDYVSSLASRSDSDTTHMRLRFGGDPGELWIGDLRMAIDLRCNGLGSRLVHCAEKIAQQFGIPLVRVYPLRGVAKFWEKLGYEVHPRTKGIMTKAITLRCDFNPQRRQRVQC